MASSYGKEQGITLEWIEREHFRYTEAGRSLVFAACGHPRDAVIPTIECWDDGAKVTPDEFKHIMQKLLAADADAEPNMRFGWHCSDGHVLDLLERALEEDIGTGDVTSNAVIPEDATTCFIFNARQPLVLCGGRYLQLLYWLVDPRVKVIMPAISLGESYDFKGVFDGASIPANTKIARIEGPTRSLLIGERVALNLMQQLSGVATLTRSYVGAVEGTNAQILDTRKTIPGLRALQKYAVRCGGGTNHRIGLYDAVLIKDNHIAAVGGVTAAVTAAKAHAPEGMTIEVECDTLTQLDEALAVGCDVVLLDNMDNASLIEGVKRAHSKGVKVEASGNVNLTTVRGIAETGVDYISVGKLTHSAVAVDIGLDEA